MVSAKKGYLLTCDIPAKVFIVNLNANYKSQGKKEFIIADLDDKTVLINPSHLEEVQAELKKYADAITYQVPDKTPGAQQA